MSQIENLQKSASPGEEEQNEPVDPFDGGGDAYADRDESVNQSKAVGVPRLDFTSIVIDLLLAFIGGKICSPHKHPVEE